jgi:TRAP transporter TAXI family solute receptor
MKQTAWMAAALGAIASFTMSPAMAQEKTTVEFIGAQSGAYSYQVMYAATVIVNKGSAKVHGVVQESFGASDNLKRLDQDKELRKHAFAVTTIPAQYSAQRGEPKELFPQPIKGLLQVFNQANFCNWVATSDPSIKKIEDFAGKRFDGGPYGNFMGSITDAMFAAHGMKDKVGRLLHTADQAAQYDGFGDGRVDGILSGSVQMGNDTIAFNATVQKLLASRTIWPVSVSPEKVKEISQATGIPFSSCSVKAGSPNPNAPAYTGLAFAGNVVAHADMPEDLVYDIMKQIIANVEEFGKYSAQAKSMTRGNLAAINVPVSDFHPGAIRAYREAGLKIGEENFR